MSRCRGCDREIEVKWIQPAGCEAPILECLCSECLLWADVAMGKGNVQPPDGRRKVKDKLPWDDISE